MFEWFGFEEMTPGAASVFFALGLGLAFGSLAEVTRFCFRRTLVGTDRRAAAGIWAAALITAVLGTQAAVLAGLVDFQAHRFFAADLPVLAIAVGGLMFGAGMVLTRGCVSRLTVLAGTGNLRAVLVLVVFAVVAHATLKGVFAPVRVTLGTFTLPLGDTVSLAALPGGLWTGSALLVALAGAVVLRSDARWRHIFLAALLGLLVPLGWVGTGFVLFDEFDPIPLESLSFTAPYADSLFWTVAATSIPAGFGTGLIGGVLAGALVTSVIGSRFAWQSFDGPRQTGRYLAGAALMGVGGVLAGGCTVGAGLSGVPTLSVSALLAIVFVAIGAKAADAMLSGAPAAPVGSEATPALQPAE